MNQQRSITQSVLFYNWCNT